MIKYKVFSTSGKLLTVSYTSTVDDDGEPRVNISDRIRKDIRFYQSSGIQESRLEVYLDNELLQTVKIHKR